MSRRQSLSRANVPDKIAAMPSTPNNGGLGDVSTGPSIVPSDEHPAMHSVVATKKERPARRFIWAALSDSLDGLSCECRWFAAGDEPPGAGGEKG